jgi:hypothetical protein
MLWDSELTGFGVRISPKGKASFFANKWQGGTAGRHKRVTLGHFPHLTVQAARNLAIKELADASNGIDIAARKKEKKHKAQLDGITLQEAVQEFIKRRGRRSDYWKEVKRIL